LGVPSERVAGAYGGTIGCFTCDEGDGGAISTTAVAAESPGVISMFGGSAWFFATDTLIYRSAASGRELRFLLDERGKVRYMVQGPNSFARLDEVLLDELLGSGWRERRAEPLVAKVYRAMEDWPAAARAYPSLSRRTPENGACFRAAGAIIVAGATARSRRPSLQEHKELRTLRPAFLMLPFMAATATFAQEPRPTTLAGRSTVYAPNGVVATSQPLATAAALAVLERGGTAVDAAVVAAAVLTVVEPHNTGIGGDLFALVWAARDQRLHGLNASGRSGSLMTRETLVERGRTSITGAESITVPGALSGWDALLRRFGTLSLAEALAPAIRLAEQGFPVTPIIAGQWAADTNRLRRDDGARATYLMDGARAPAAGEWFTNRDYAAVLRAIAQHGAAHLYGGPLGERIAAHVQSLGGFLTAADFAAHAPTAVEPVSVPYRGYRLWELPPNGQGIAALSMLRILEGFDLRSLGHNTPDYLHHLVEAKKLAYADIEYYVGDPEHMRVTPETLLGDEWIAARRAQFDAGRAADRPDPGAAVSASETIYLSVADRDGNMVSFINSVYSAFGSGIVVPGTGFALQNRGAGFSIEDGRANTVAPRKLPFHTIIPAFITRTTRDSGVSRDAAGEEPWLAFGVMGGAMQPQGHVQVLLNLVEFEMDLQQAIDAPRFRHLSGLRLALEAPIGDEVRRALAALGHDIVAESGVAFGGAQAVMRLARGWAAGSDPRKDGMAAGH
jgi:gamma-glutamyltranspeptidase / glutathione hydrolase